MFSDICDYLRFCYHNPKPGISPWTSSLLVIFMWKFKGLIGPWGFLGLGPNVAAFSLSSIVECQFAQCVKTLKLSVGNNC